MEKHLKHSKKGGGFVHCLLQYPIKWQDRGHGCNVHLCNYSAHMHPSSDFLKSY